MTGFNTQLAAIAAGLKDNARLITLTSLTGSSGAFLLSCLFQKTAKLGESWGHLYIFSFERK